MDIGATTSLAQYNYQTTAQTSGQSAAVLQALDQAYTAVSDASAGGTDPLTALAGAPDTGTDPLAALAGASAVGPLVSAITTLAQAANPAGGSGGITGVQAIPTFGGLSVTSATSLLASLGTSTQDTSGLQGFDAAVNGNVNLAIAAYQAQQAYPVTAPAAQASPSSTPTSTAGTSPAAVPATTWGAGGNIASAASRQFPLSYLGDP